MIKRTIVNSIDLNAEVQAICLFDNRYGTLRISELERPLLVDDAQQVFVLSDSAGIERAVLHCSPLLDPDAVLRAVEHVRQMKKHLNARAGAFVVDVLAEGRLSGLSYCVSPFCYGLSKRRPLRWIQRSLIRPRIFAWLLDVVKSTVIDVAPDRKDAAFAKPLQQLVACPGISSTLREHAERALERLSSGAWKPRQVVMHGDFWRGNIMIRPSLHSFEWWPDRAVIIDWASSLVHGYAIYDLVCMAESLKMSAKALRRELEQHCELLQCELSDSRCYLVAALAWLQLNRGFFQLERYQELAQECFFTLDRALAS